MKNKIYISDLHFEHTSWKSELLLQKDELKIFQKRIEEIASRLPQNSILKKVEHFQNNFIRHNEVIDILLHSVGEHEQELSSFAKDHPVAINHVYFKDHSSLREEIETQRKIYLELKTEFMSFLTEAM